MLLSTGTWLQCSIARSSGTSCVCATICSTGRSVIAIEASYSRLQYDMGL